MKDEQFEHVSSQWDQRYRENGWSVVPDAPLIELTSHLTPGRGIDLGCGTGRNALALARAGWEMTGVDASATGLQMLADQATREGLSVTTVRASLLEFTAAPSTFDLVVVANIHFGPAERQEFFARAGALVTPGGHLYVIGHHVDAFGLSGPPDRDRLYTLEMFDTLCEDFTPLLVERRESGDEMNAMQDVTALWWGVKNKREKENV